MLKEAWHENKNIKNQFFSYIDSFNSNVTPIHDDFKIKSQNKLNTSEFDQTDFRTTILSNWIVIEV